MQKRIANAKKDEGGFTLIEMLVVIVILGILAAVVMFGVGALNNESEETACQAEYRTLVLAEEAFYANDDAPPRNYTDGAGLLAAGLIDDLPTGFTVAAPGGSTYTITPVAGGDCVGVDL